MDKKKKKQLEHISSSSVTKCGLGFYSQQTWDTSLYLLYDNDDPFWLTMIWGP